MLEMILQVSRNPQTGESRGSGYVTMGSINSAKIAIASLDAKVRSLETKKKKKLSFYFFVELLKLTALVSCYEGSRWSGNAS